MGTRPYLDNLSPFVPELYLRVWVTGAENVTYVDEGTEEVFGFKPRSKQSRFFTDPKKGSARVVCLLYEAGPRPVSMTDERVVARFFGTLDRDSSLELWHLSVNPSHPLNDSARGKRWGVHSITRDDTGSKTRWRGMDGTKLTNRNSEGHVRGSPNPYAVECLVRGVEVIHCPSVRQHDQMPCANLFHSDYNHSTHPSTLVIFKTLDFRKPPSLAHYMWMRSLNTSLLHSHSKMVQCMQHGISCV